MAKFPLPRITRLHYAVPRPGQAGRSEGGAHLDAIDSIYEAAVVPEKWVDALGAMTAQAGAIEGSLFLYSEDAPPRTISFNQPEGLFAQYQQCWQDSPSTQWGLATRPPAFTTFRANLPAEVLESDPAIAILRQRGICDAAVSMHPLDDGHTFGFGFVRHFDQGLFRARDLAGLNALRPHILRAGLTSARLGMERARSMVATLDGIGLAAAVLAQGGKVIAANPAFESLPRLLVPTAFGGVALSDKVLDARFREALARAGNGKDGPAVSIAIPADATGEPMLVHLLPVRGQAHDIFAGGHVLMVAASLRRRNAPSPELLDGLFDLTRAEARLVCEMARGGTLPEIAERLGLSRHTLRAQFRSIATKTGVRRQTELAQLLAAL